MLRRWSIAVAITALSVGSLIAAAGAAASAAPVAGHPGGTYARSGHAARGFRPGGVMIRPAGARPATGHGRNATVTSTNWSGYAVTGANGTFTSVSASWTQPAGKCAKGAKGNKYAAFWVGLDGYSSTSVEQTGTDSDCSGLTPKYYGWYEMYPAFPVNFSNTVKPGDAMSASVTFSGTKTYTLVLRDKTQGWTKTIVKSNSGLDRSSAEVITEAPSSGTGVLPLADFGTIHYAASTDDGSSMGTQSPTAIVMVDGSGNDKDSTSSIARSGAFSNTWFASK